MDEIKIVTNRVYLSALEKTLKQWKSFGAVSTPREIVELMIKLADIRKWEGLDILEPACGFCNFILSIYTKYPYNNFYGVEINREVYQKIKDLFKDLHFHLINEDFLLWSTDKKFDLIIGNPPYGIIGDKSHYPIYVLKEEKEKYKKAFSTWYGKYNVYGAFVEKSIYLLKPEGKLILIIPSTWMILEEYKKLRAFLAGTGKVKVYYLGNNIFKGISVSVCILVFEKGGRGAELYTRDGKNYNFKLHSSLHDWDGDILRFETEDTRELEKGKTRLGEIFEIRISARSTELKNIEGVENSRKHERMKPFMNGRNIQKGFIVRENFSGLWIEEDKIVKVKSFYGVVPRIVVGHTKGGRIVAAIENELFPYVGDVYHLLPKVPISNTELIEIVDWLNSEDINNYMKTLYKDITPHTTATQLKTLPLHKKFDKNPETLFTLWN